MHQNGGAFPALVDADEAEELVEKDIRDRFKKMCEGYFDSVAKKLVIEHKVCPSNPILYSSNELMATMECRGCKSRTEGITRRTFARVRSSRIDSKHTKR